MLVEGFDNLPVIGIGVLFQKSRRGNHDPRRAIPALGRTFFDEFLLHPMPDIVFVQAFGGNDLGILELRDGANTAQDMLAVRQYRAGAALFEPAAKLRAGQTQMIAQDENQRRCRIGLNRLSLAVNLKRKFGHYRWVLIFLDWRGVLFQSCRCPSRSDTE